MLKGRVSNGDLVKCPFAAAKSSKRRFGPVPENVAVEGGAEVKTEKGCVIPDSVLIDAVLFR
jgi:hypothetical protein